MSDKKAKSKSQQRRENIMQHSGIETGYFRKRKEKFDDEIAKGIDGRKASVPKQIKPKKKED